jgi:rhamnulose-1-phosphate aldolase/alcohol dehydrogenase
MAEPLVQYPKIEQALTSLVHYSRLLGADPTLVLGGGGNTSMKAIGEDVAGRRIPVLLIKGSGSELRSAQPRDFPALRLPELLAVRARQELSDEEMVDYLGRCKLDPTAPRPSIETLLHAFIPAVAVFHSHADAILSLTNTRRSEAVVRDALGDIPAIPYQRPGFALSKAVGSAADDHPKTTGVVLLNHGLVTWGDTAEAAYEGHIALVQRALDYVASRRQGRVASTRQRPVAEQRRAAAARIAPVLRGALSSPQRTLLQLDDSDEVLDFLAAPDCRQTVQAGAATPDHILTTKNLPLWLDVPPTDSDDEFAAAIRTSVEQYRTAYGAYFGRWRTDEPELDANPRVILVPGVGLFTAGRDLKSARLARDIYRHTISVMAGAEALGGYASLDEAEAFRAEYWPLELYKLTLAPVPAELAGRVAIVTGAGSGLGRAIAHGLARVGAHVLITDLDEERATDTARSGKAGQTVACRLDVTDEAAVEHAIERACLEFGGVDIVVSNAGYAQQGRLTDLDLADWERSFAVNARGHFLITRAALRLFRRQNIGGSIVFIGTKNVTDPGAEFGAYSASKAAEVQLARVAAIEGGPLGVRVNVVNPDAIFTGSHLWDDLREDRARAHGVSPEQLESFYRQRSLLGLEVRGEDVAEAVLFLASDRSSRTTGAMLPVDGGVKAAFPR